MHKKQITNAECRTEFDIWRKGSVRRGTISAGVSEFRSHFVVESPESDHDVELLIRLAKQGCFAEQLVQNAVPLRSTYSVNGRDAQIEL